MTDTLQRHRQVHEFSHSLRDAITADKWTFDVIDMDGIRVDKLLATRNAPPAPAK